jgi:hypothetical protein
MLDLSHWFYHRNRMPWDLSRGYERPEHELIGYHRKMGVGFYLPNLGSFLDVDYGENVRATVTKSADGREITWAYETPLGVIRRTRRWEDQTYAWGIPAWGLRTERDLKILGRALASRTYTPHWERYQAWRETVGDGGVVYLPLGYSAMGHLLHYWLGVERTVYATAEWPGTVREAVDQINANNLVCVDLAAESPAEVILVGDNFSSDVQPPHFFNEWSRAYYAEVIRRVHAADKYVAVHVDGRLRGLLRVFRDLGADCIDAVTPAPTGDLDPEQCRDEAGPGLILSGGASPNLWLPEVDRGEFKRAVMRWLALKKHGPRLIANAGDQVPPGAVEDRIELMRDLVEEHGGY